VNVVKKVLAASSAASVPVSGAEGSISTSIGASDDDTCGSSVVVLLDAEDDVVVFMEETVVSSSPADGESVEPVTSPPAVGGDTSGG